MPPSAQTAPPGAPIRDIPADLLHHFYDSVSLLMGVVELHGDDILHVINNAATATFFGTTPDALQGRLASELGVGAADRARWLRHYRKSEETGESVRFHYAHETPNGQRWLKATVSHLGSGSSGADRFSYYAEEVTEQVTQHAALLANEARQEALLGALPDLLFRLDRDGRYLDVHAPDALTAPTEALFGRTLHEVLPEDLADRLAAAIEHALDTGAIQLVEYDLPGGNGQRQYFEARVSPDAEHDEALVIVRDRTERQRSRLKLRATAGRLGSLIRNLQAAVLVEDEDGRVVLANQRFCDLFGVEAASEALVGVDGAEAVRTVMPLVRDPEGFAARVAATLEARQRVLAEEVEMAGGRMLERDYIPVELDGAYAGHLWLYRDVTQRKATEQALLQSEARFRSLVEDSSDVITVLDPNGTVRYASDSVERVLGYKPEELIDQSSFALIHPDAVAEVQQAFADVLQRPGQSLTAQAPILHKDGTWRVLSMTGVNLVENPTVEGIVISARDVTPQVKAEQALRSAEAKFRGMVEKSLVGSMIIQDGRFSYVNPRMAEIFGYTPEEMVALPSALDIIHEENRPIVHADLRRSLDHEADFVSYGVSGRRKDGGTIHVELAGVADEYDGRPAVIGTTRDVTARVKAERRLREQKAQLTLIMEAVPDAFVFSDVDRRIERVNSAFTRLLGYDAEEALGTTTRQLYADEAEFARTGHEPYNRDGQVHLDPYPVEYRRKDGSVFVGETVGAPVRTEDGETIGYLGLIRDVTERETQRERLASVVALQQAIARFPLNGELEEVLAHVAAEAGHLTGADGAVIELAEGDELVYRGVSGSAEGNLGLRLRIDGSLSGRCVRTGEVVNCVDAEHDDRVDPEAVRKVGVRSMAIVPLIYRGDSFGVLKVFSGTKTHAFDGDHVATLRLIAGQLAAVVSHARAFEAQREREAHFRAVFEHSPYAMALAPVRASIEQVNGAFRRLFDLTDETAEGLSFHDLTHPDDVDASVEALERLWVGQVESIRLEKRYVTPRGREVVADVTVFPLRSEDGAVTHSIAIIDDITERERQACELARSEARYRLLAENMNDLVCLHAADGTYEWVSPSVKDMLGYQPRELVGVNPYTLFHPDDVERVQHESHERLAEGVESDTGITYRMRHKDGHWVSLETLTQTILDSEGEVEQLQTASRDVSERREMEDRLYHQAHHDALTGLPNRTLFCKRLDEAVATAEREGEYAVLFLDLDRFKTVNDSLGHTAGDNLLQKVARRLEAQVRPFDTVARFGGDEFAVLLRRLPQPGHAEAVAERIAEALRAPVRIDGHELVAGASIGVVTGRADHDSADALLLEADLAMYDAKKSGRGTYATFSQAVHEATGRRHQLEMDLRHAADRGQLRAAYQPVVRLADGALTGFEALVRWEHPEFGLLYPDAFIEIAEESGQVALIDRWILEEACRQTTRWREAFNDCPLLVLNVNCSSRDLVEEGYSEHVRRILDDQRFAPDRLLLEITESLLVEDTELAAAELQRLRDRGVRFCIDDFGTGYSSLSTLHALPIDTIKVDRSFVSKMEAQSRSRKLAETVVRLGRILDKSVVAEGIETPAQLDALRRMGCDCGQGYLFARPLTPEAATALIAADVLPWAEHWKGAAGPTEQP